MEELDFKGWNKQVTQIAMKDRPKIVKMRYCMSISFPIFASIEFS